MEKINLSEGEKQVQFCLLRDTSSITLMDLVNT